MCARWNRCRRCSEPNFRSLAGTVSIFSRLLIVNSCRSAAMSFSTTSYLAGVGSVVAALTVGFSGGLFMAAPTPYAEQNRLQRVMSSAPIASPTPQIAAAPKPEITEVNATSRTTSAIQQPARPETIPVMAKAAEPEGAPVMAKAPEPVRTASEQERGAQMNANAEKVRAAEARAAERKRAEARKLAERQKQREIELATVAVKRMLRDRDPQQVADGIETPRFGFFGQD
jgi:hypothetical protein